MGDSALKISGPVYYKCVWAWTSNIPVLKPGRIYRFRDEKAKQEILDTLLHNGYILKKTTKKEYEKQELMEALE